MNFPKKITKIQAFFIALLLITLSLIGVFVYNYYFKEYEFEVKVNGDFEKDDLYVKKVVWDKNGKIKLGEKIHFTIEIYHKYPINFNESGAGIGKSEYYGCIPFPSLYIVHHVGVYLADQRVKNYFDNGTIIILNITANKRIEEKFEYPIYEYGSCLITDINGNTTYASFEIGFKENNFDAFIPCASILLIFLTIFLAIIFRRKLLT